MKALALIWRQVLAANQDRDEHAGHRTTVLNYGAPLARAFGPHGAPLKSIWANF